MEDQLEGKPSSRTLLSAVAYFLTIAAFAISMIVISTSPASAATDFCGRRVEPINPGKDGLTALEEQLAQGKNQLIEQILRGVQLGPEWCGEAEFAMDVGADVVVGNTLLRIFRVETPGGADILIAVTQQAAERLRENQPTELPSVLPSDAKGGNWAPVAWTGNVGINIRPAPSTAQSPVGAAPEGAMLRIECASYGEKVTNKETHQSSSLWYRVTYNDFSGFVNDTFLDTGTTEPVAQPC